MGPLEGLTVVDLSERSVSTAVACMLLADYGADVIRVEPQGGDPLRALKGTNVWLRGQRSVTSGDDGLSDDEVLDLCRSADIVLDTAQAWTSKSVTYSPPFPVHQVYCLLTATPADPEGIAAGRRPSAAVYGELIEAQYGLMYVQEGVRRDAPIFMGLPHAAFGAAWLVALGVLSAYYSRLRTGRGQVVTTSLVDAIGMLNNWRWVGGGDPPTEAWPPRSSWDRLGNSRFILGMFECADGWLQVNVGAKGAANRFFRLIGREDLIDPKTDTDIYNPMTQDVADSLWDHMRKIFKTKPVDAWREELSAIDVSAMPVLQPGEAFSLEQTRDQALVDTTGGRVQYGLSAKFDRTPGGVGTFPHEPGADNGGVSAAPGRVAPPLASTADGSASTRGPLEGLNVVDAGLFVAGPFAMRLLADLGARVIKIDDPSIVGRPMPGHTLGWNHGKESIAINLKSEEGRSLALELIARADVFHHNQRFGVMERIGLGAEDVRAGHPELIYSHSSGYGNHGPWANLPVFGPLPDALAGTFARTGGRDNRPLHYVSHVDYGNAMNAAPLVLAALIERERSGEGQSMETVQFGASLFWMSDCYFDDGELSQTFELDALQRGHAPTNALYPTSDGWIVLACYAEREWAAAHSALGVPEAEPYPEARGRPLSAHDHDTPLAKALVMLTTAQALERLTAAGVACVSPDPTLIVPDLLLETDLPRTGPIVTYAYPEHGDIFEVGRPIRFSTAPDDLTTRTPFYGEHTRDVLRELGRDSAEIDRLLSERVVVEYPGIAMEGIRA